MNCNIVNPVSKKRENTFFIAKRRGHEGLLYINCGIELFSSDISVIKIINVQ